MKSTHSDRLERWLGTEAVDGLVRVMQGRNWYGGPIAVHGVPGSVYLTKDGDFIGEIRTGEEVSAVDRALDYLVREGRSRRARIAQQKSLGSVIGSLRRLEPMANAFTNISQVVAAATGGKAQDLFFNKTGIAANAIGSCNDLWVATGQPVAGAAGAAAAAGTAHTSANAGAMPYTNPSNANLGHFVSAWITASVVANSLMLYDRLFSVAKTMNSTATEAVTGVPTRYQNQTALADDYIGGTFVFPMNPTTVLAATAHNWTVCQYTDQAGNTANSIPSIAGVSACVVGGVDLGAGFWFMPLASGDVGAKALTQMQCSALVATGTITFVLAQPIAMFPAPVANMICPADGLYTAFNLKKIYDNACMSFLEMPKPATTATTYSGWVKAVAE